MNSSTQGSLKMLKGAAYRRTGGKRHVWQASSDRISPSVLSEMTEEKPPSTKLGYAFEALKMLSTALYSSQIAHVYLGSKPAIYG
jgi:hypothetical protein